MAERREIVSEIIEDMLCEKILRLKAALELSEERVGDMLGILNALGNQKNPGNDHKDTVEGMRDHIAETRGLIREALEKK